MNWVRVPPTGIGVLVRGLVRSNCPRKCCGSESTGGTSSCCGLGRRVCDVDDGVVIVSRRGGGERVLGGVCRDAFEVGGVKTNGCVVVSTGGCDVGVVVDGLGRSGSGSGVVIDG